MTEKSGSSKRFGARYGLKIRENVDEAESKEKRECPECGSDRVERTAAGIFECQKCGNQTAGGAFEIDTGASEMLTKALKSGTEELEEAKEEVEE